jgi:hypothetical protein
MIKSEAHPWLDPLYRRIGVVLFICGWIAFELWTEPGGFWLWMMVAALAWAIWDFFLAGNYPMSVDQPSERSDAP